MTTITGSNGSDLLTGTAGSDTINGGNGDDTVSGGAGSDALNGGAGNDTLDGGSGSDQLNGGSGSDTLIYNVSENLVAGTKDVYTGGAGVDTLQLLFTRAQWLDSATQTQIAAYLAHLAAVTNAKTGEVSNGSASDFVFTFGSSTLTVQMTEVLRILVDGVEVNPANEAATALGDAVATTEDGPGIQIHVLQNDLVPDLIKSLALASAPAHGTATLVQPAMGDPSTWYFQYQPNTAHFQHLAAGENATDTFTYQVTDADGGTGLATVTVTITGANDGPIITSQDLVGAVSEQVAPAGTLSDSGVIGFSDLDLSDVHLVSATGTPVGSVLGSLTAVKNSDTTGTGTGGQLTWTYTVDATAVEYLAAGETRVESFTITVNDQHGGIVTRQIDVTITGTNDAPMIGAADAAAAVTEDAATPILSDSGTITFDDVDLSDVHGVSVAAGPGNTLGGVLTAGVSDSATGAGDGTVSWNYSVANAATQYLAQGQTATETFTVSINDGHGGTVNQQITVTVTGTNDVPVIGGVASGAVSEDGSTPNLSTSGALTIADVDQGQSNFTPQASTAGSNGYGSFTLAADGSWTYIANNGQGAIQQLGAGESISDSFTAVSSDGTASRVVTVTITGTNDVPVIGGVATGAVSEDASTPNLSTGGALTIADVDQGQSSFAPQGTTAGSNGYGSFTLASDGSWSYTADNSQAAIQQLGAGQSISDSFTAVSSDGTASQVVTVTIVGTNDVPVIGGVATGAVSEDASTPNLSTSGALTIADVDQGQSNFAPQANVAGSNGYGSFTLASDGSWSYAADNSQAAIQQLGAGQSISDSFTAVSSDGTASQVVTVTITGTNDVPVIGGVTSGALSEDASTPNLSTSGALTIADVDAGQSNFAPQASTAGGNGYGSFTLASDGSWSYAADNSQAAIQQLAAGQSISDSFTAVSLDGTASQVVTVTITGTNDVPVIGGAASGAVSEDASTPNLSTGGGLTIADVDAGQSNFAPQASTAGSSGYGSFTLAADGNWIYAADNSQSAIQQLGAGESISDSFTAVSSDGTASQVVTVTITGTNDVPVIGGVASGAVSEDASTPNLSASGALTIADIDQGQSSFTAQAGTVGSNGYGSFSLLADGSWSYTADNSQGAIQQLGAGQSINDSFTAVSSDGTASQVVTVTITGTNDVPVIGGVAIGAVSEDASAPNLSTGGALTIVDVDQGQSNFAPQASTAGSSGYGSFTLAADGTWTYTADNSQSAIQQLASGQSISDSFTAVSSDGTANQLVTVTITGTNDVPVIGGVASGAVNEDDSTPNLSTGGALTIADVDAGQSSFTAQGGIAGSSGYGSFTLAANGTWTYTANNSQAAIQQLGAGQSISDSFTAVSSDGTASQVVTVTITGTNDVPVIAGVASGAVQEDVAVAGGSLAASGALTIADVDAGQSNFTPQASTAGGNGYGSFTLAANGTWTYTANNGQAAIQQLGAGQSISDSFTAVSSDGAASQLVTVTITGTNDVAVIGGVATGAVSEDASTPNLSTGGALTIADADAGQSSFITQLGIAGSNGYGNFTLAANGTWTYTADNSQSTIQQLAAGQSISDSFTAASSDGTASQVVTVTIAGTNDAPVLSAAATPALQSVNEGAGAPAGAVGTLVSSLVNLTPPSGDLDNVSDADNSAATGIALTGVNAANGSWWYSTDGGTNWAAVGAVSDASALLLAADANTRVYFQADSNFSGSVSDGITFRAWDQTSGTAGTTVSTVTNGGSSAFSSATDTATITVNVVNVNPVPASDVLYVSNNTAVTLSTSVLLANDTDIDGAALSVTAISVVTGTLATPITINADGTFSFTTGSTGGTVGSPTVVTLSYTLSDGVGGSATGSVTLNVLDTTSGANTVDLTGVAAYQGAYIDGKAGGDTLRDGAFQSVLVGSNGNDQLFGNAGSDLLIGGENVDTLDGGAGNDVLRGGNNNDDIDGGAGTEDLIDFSDGLSGITFTLTQSSGNTAFNGPGSLGTDTYRNIEGVIGTANADTLTGSASNDILRGGGGNDTLDGAGGTGDLLDLSDGTAGLTFTLTQSSSTTTFNASAAGLGTDSYKNFEGVIGTAFADTITGSASNDQLRGGGGNDVINGLAGDDRIAGGTGADILTGGADNDTFVFDSAPNAVDSVTDFNASGSAASGDLVELSLGTFTALSTASGSTLSAAEFASSDGGGAGDTVGAGVHVIYDSATGNLYYDADGLSAANRTLVATLTLTNPADTFDSNDIKVGL
ncbi:VCBS repeat-containing protein [Variovorax paradoxus]|uniref:beta strand repeat-containing protein n=1 Tax=Variovorax paradoxus TaxID=34073 RepID=UPI00278A184A|nr:VCBS domain-containing protein [Variovorax paradoxus]MDQ0027475.1 VCBS repeat-containing protein [Variovorax paradoxus]